MPRGLARSRRRKLSKEPTRKSSAEPIGEVIRKPPKEAGGAVEIPYPDTDLYLKFVIVLFES